MNPCSEYVLSGVAAITAIPVADYTSTAYMLSPVIDGDGFDPIMDNAIVIGTVASAGRIVPIVHSTGKLKDTTSDNVAGRLHNVSVECEADDRDTATWPVIRQLERTPSHLILMLHDGSRVFVRATEDTYLCTVERGSGKAAISFKIQNLMGVQAIE